MENVRIIKNFRQFQNYKLPLEKDDGLNPVFDSKSDSKDEEALDTLDELSRTLVDFDVLEFGPGYLSGSSPLNSS